MGATPEMDADKYEIPQAVQERMVELRRQVLQHLDSIDKLQAELRVEELAVLADAGKSSREGFVVLVEADRAEIRHRSEFEQAGA